MTEKSDKKSGTTNQYPNYFRGKNIRIITTATERFVGELLEIQEYRGKSLLIVQAAGFDPRIVNFDHVIYIEEVQ